MPFSTIASPPCAYIQSKHAKTGERIREHATAPMRANVHTKGQTQTQTQTHTQTPTPTPTHKKTLTQTQAEN